MIILSSGKNNFNRLVTLIDQYCKWCQKSRLNKKTHDFHALVSMSIGFVSSEILQSNDYQKILGNKYQNSKEQHPNLFFFVKILHSETVLEKISNLNIFSHKNLTIRILTR